MTANQITERAAKMKNSISGAASEVISAARDGKSAECAVRFVLGVVLSAVRLFGAYAPFGMSAVAVSGPGTAGALALLGSMLSYLIFGGLKWGFRYAATAFLIFTANVVFRRTVFPKKVWFAPLNALFMAAVTGFPYVIDAGFGVRTIALYVMETVLCGGCAYFYAIALSPWSPGKQESNTAHSISMLILAVTFAAALANVKPLGGISLGKIAACIAVMLTAFRCGGAIGCAVGVLAGLIMDVSRGYDGVLYGVSFALSALVAPAFARRSKLRFACCFVIVNALSVLWFSRSGENAPLYEVFCASVAFMLMPESVCERLPLFLSGSVHSSGGRCSAGYLRARVLRLADAFRELYKTVRVEPEEGEENKMSVFERVPEECCGGCALETSCWEQELETTQENLSRASDAMLTRGSAEKTDFPGPFREKCLRLGRLTDVVNSELRLMRYRRQYRSRMHENKSAAHQHYAEMAEILEQVADDLKPDGRSVASLQSALGRFLSSRGVSAETEIYRDVGGRLRVEIFSDSLRALRSDEKLLDSLSAALGMRLCEKRVLGEMKHMLLMEAEPLAVSVGVAAVRKRGESVSGDRGTYFKTDEGVFYVILSDGMGSGENAAKESAETVKTLESFLKAGLSPETALSLLNSSLQLGGTDEPVCAGIDVMSVDLFTGEMQLCKFGAAPTYIRAGETVRRICTDSVAAGTFTGLIGRPDVTRMHLAEGTTAVIISDGVETDDDMWLREMLSSNTGLTERELAREVLQESIRLRGCEDDMTVLAVRMERRA